MYKFYLIFSAIIFSTIASFGQAGIGSTPTTVAGIGPGKLDITGTGDFVLRLKGDDFVGFGIQSFRNNGSDHAMINLFGARGTMSSPSAILSGDNVSTISSRAYTGSGYTPITSIQSYYTGTNQGTITFSTNGGSSTTERMRINHDGNVGIGTSSPNYIFHVKSSNPTTAYFESTTADNNGIVVLNANTNQYWANNYHEFMYFQNQGSNIGGVYGSNGGNQVSYNTSSDYRLKKDLKDFDGVNLVNKIKVYDFAWKSTGDRMYGVMAHELQGVLPYAVSGNKDELNSDGTPKIQSVDYSKLTPILIKAIQEQEIKIQEQQKQIELLIKRLEMIEKQ